MPINRASFLQYVTIHLFDGKVSASQRAGLKAILDEWEQKSPGADDRWLGYMLGTAHHETGRTMQAVRETFASSDDQAIARLDKAFSTGKLPWVKQRYWQKDPNGKSWLGRGLVQLTHKVNYQTMSPLVGVDLVGDPTRAMDLDTAVKIMFVGMARGSFTGKKLGDYFAGPKQDWRNGRRIINGIERADLVASYAKHYYAAISYTV